MSTIATLPLVTASLILGRSGPHFAAARREIDSLRFQVRATQFLLELQNDRVRATPAALLSWLGQDLRRLLTMAYPDKWSQGQDAAAVAHDVAAAVKAFRSYSRNFGG